MIQSPQVIRIFPMECNEYGCGIDKGRVEFRSDGEVTFVFQCRHKHPHEGWQNHWQRVSITNLARMALKLDPLWLEKLTAKVALAAV